MVRFPLVGRGLLFFVWLMVRFRLVLRVVLLVFWVSSVSGKFLDCRHYVRSLVLAGPKGGLLVVVA